MELSNQTGNNGTESGNFYSGVFEMNVSKLIGISASVVNVAGFSPMFFAIIWYERHGTGMRRYSLILISGFTILGIIKSHGEWVTKIQTK